jgi:N-methylhydantoinase B/oxoprolinase/acetone carboxylase alpha subunit
VKGQHGWGAMNVGSGNLIRATAEINESIFPIRHLARDYDTDSGGAGEFRGGCGSVYRKQVLTPSTVYTDVVGKRFPMPEIAGGRDGSLNKLLTRVAPDGGDPGHRGKVDEMPERICTGPASATSTITSAAAAGATR